MNKTKVAVFGRGEYFLFKKRELLKKYEIVAFLDNNPEKKFDGIDENCPVYSLEQLDKIEKNIKIIIMTSQKSFIQVIRQLLDLGVDEKRIIPGANLNPPFDATEKELARSNGAVVINNSELYLEIGQKTIPFFDRDSYKEIMRNQLDENNPFVKAIKQLDPSPISSKFGRDLGEPIDRYYIEKFLETNRDDIHGVVMEVGDDSYTRRFGQNVDESIVIHVDGAGKAIKANLETGEGITDEMADCFICTQTIQMIFDIKSAMRNIYRLLRKGGSALITIHGISQISTGDYSRWGEYWRVTGMAAKKIAMEAGFDDEKIQVTSYGNAKTSIAFLMGMCQEQLEEKDFSFIDDNYPLIVSLKCLK